VSSSQSGTMGNQPEFSFVSNGTPTLHKVSLAISSATSRQIEPLYMTSNHTYSLSSPISEKRSRAPSVNYQQEAIDVITPSRRAGTPELSTPVSNSKNFDKALMKSIYSLTRLKNHKSLSSNSGTELKKDRTLLPGANQEVIEEKKDITVGCGCGNTLLIVDDEFFNLKTIEMVLKGQPKFKYVKAFDGYEAYLLFCKKIQENLCKECLYFKAVLMDLNMPNMDGAESASKMIDFLRSIGKDEKDLPIIALSAYTDQENVDHCMNKGMAAFMNKPIKKKAVLGLLEELGVKLD
jgi:CheY-like chemotaxis protein